MNKVLSIEEVITDYFLLGENPLAIAYRRRKGQKVCRIVINSKFISYGRE